MSAQSRWDLSPLLSPGRIGLFTLTAARGWVVFRPLMANPDFQAFDFAWMVAGGPVASVLFALLSALIFARSGNGGWDWIGTMFWISLFSVVMPLFPYPRD